MIAYIPTKSRYNTKTYKLFEDVGIPFIHFIEPLQYDDYEIPNKVNIGANNQGIAYVRNFMLNYAKQNNHDWIIMCDDDVTDFGYAKDNKCITHNASLWKEVYDKAKKLPFNLYGLNYRQHAWHEKHEYRINTTFVEVCVLINVKSINWQYRSEYNMKEDRDFVLQSIKYGNGCVKFLKLFYNCPGVGKNSGGLQDEYKNKKDAISSKKMVAEWHPFAKLIEKDGRLDVKIDLKELSSYYKKPIK